MKFLLLLVIVGGVLWLMMGRRRRGPPPAAKPDAAARGGAEPMVACAQCGVHLPKADALPDAAGRPYCSEAHRLQGPR
jgi:uncharacterized protein